MSDQVDVYRDWLGIKETARPLNHYQLLRLKLFDDGQDRIRERYRKLNAHVRKYSSGSFATESQQLLNELARAMLCLTDLERKADYDESLGREEAAVSEKRSLEEILLRQKAITIEQLEKAQQYASAVGFPLRDALAQQKLLPQVALMQAYAESIGLPFLELADFAIEESLLPKISAVLARRHSVVPVLVEDDQLLLASPNPLDLQLEEDLRMRLEMRIRMVLCTPADVNRLIAEYYPREAAEAELAMRSDDDSNKEPSGLEKAWDRIKQWVKEHNQR